MLARTEWTLAYGTKSERKAARRAERLNRAKRQALIDKVAAIMRIVEPTPFAAESPCRHAIRSALCLQGWSWQGAEDVARETVRAALDTVRAKRPTWDEGQPEWTRPGGLPIERERCARCHKRLPEGHWKFCGKLCRQAARLDRDRQRRAGEVAFGRLAAKAV